MRIAAIFAIDVMCGVVLYVAAFHDEMAAWGGEHARPRPPVHLAYWVLLGIGVVLAIHAIYAYWHWWIADAGFQGIAAIVALIMAFSLLSSPDDGAANPGHPAPAEPAQTTMGQDFFCYSGGQCYLNGVPVSGHP
jgi:hypothetical protein